MKKFWLVMKHSTSTYVAKMHKRHDAFMDAKTEAERLCQKEKGPRFYIMEVVGYVEPAGLPTRWVTIDEEGEIA